MLNLREGKHVIEPSDVVDFSVPARNEGSAAPSKGSVQSIGFRPEIVVGGSNRSTQMERSVNVGLERRGEKTATGQISSALTHFHGDDEMDVGLTHVVNTD